MSQQMERGEGLFEPSGQHRVMTERLSHRWAEAESLAAARLAQYRARRAQAPPSSEPATDGPSQF